MTSLKVKEKNAKVVFSLESPYPELSSAEWPYIPPSDQQAIEELLCSLLHSATEDHHAAKTASEASKKQPIVGSLAAYLLIGPNALTSHLETLSKKNAPVSLPSHLARDRDKKKKEEEKGIPRLAAAFVTRLDAQPSLLHAHLPLLCSLAGVPLIQLPKGAEGKLCKALRMPRVGFIGLLQDAPGAEALGHTIKEGVFGFVGRPIWLDGMGAETVYLETKIKQ